MATINPAETSSMSVEHKKNGYISDRARIFEVILRVIVFVTTLLPILLLATSKQTVFFRLPFPPFGTSVSAKFTTQPALIYEIAALSVSCLYSIITTLLSFFALMKPADPRSTNLKFSVFVMDLIVVGLLAAASGAGGTVAYIGLRGNEEAKWNKICTIYDTFCLHVGFSVLSTSSAAINLIFLIVLYVFTLPASPINQY